MIFRYYYVIIVVIFIAKGQVAPFFKNLKTLKEEKMNEELNEIVTLMLDQISEKFNGPAFKIWFGGLSLISLDEEKAVFTTPSNLRQKFLSGKYKHLIEEALTDAIGFPVDIEILSTENNDDFEDKSSIVIPQPTEDDRIEADKRKKIIDDFLSDGKDGEGVKSEEDRSVLTQYTFDNFIEGDSNKFARAACMAVAMEPATTYNPLFIYGNSGLGKTHLLYAVINYIKNNHPRMKIVYKKSEDFINELIAAIQRGDTASFKNYYRKADVLLIDDIQFIAGKESTQDEFFHTFSALYESGKQIILTSDRPPKEIKPLEDRLRTRFEGGLLADVQKPSFELRTAIIKKKAAEVNMEMSDFMVEYMAERLQHDIRQIEGALKKLSAAYHLTGLEITRGIIDQVISSIDPGNIPTDTLVERILAVTASHYGVTVEDIKSKKKNDQVANARHVALYIIRKLTELPFKKIGEFVGRDHSTVMASIGKVEINIKTVKNTDADINKIIREIKSN